MEKIKQIKETKCMANSDKKAPSPSNIINAPEPLIPIMKAFHVGSKNEAMELVSEAAHAVYGTDYCGRTNPVSKKDLNAIVSLMRSIDPKDSLETLHAAQIIVSHMLGMKKLASQYSNDQKLGLDFLRFSSESIQRLVRKRSGGVQNITVNYTGHGNMLMQAVVANKGDQHEPI